MRPPVIRDTLGPLNPFAFIPPLASSGPKSSSPGRQRGAAAKKHAGKSDAPFGGGRHRWERFSVPATIPGKAYGPCPTTGSDPPQMIASRASNSPHSRRCRSVRRPAGLVRWTLRDSSLDGSAAVSTSSNKYSRRCAGVRQLTIPLSIAQSRCRSSRARACSIVDPACPGVQIESKKPPSQRSVTKSTVAVTFVPWSFILRKHHSAIRAFLA